MLQDPLADVLVYEGDGSKVTYAARSFGAPGPIAAPGELAGTLLDRLNGIRKQAKLAPLVLATKQSLENTRLAGTIFDASLRGDDATADRAAIGLLAGWDVEGGTIRGGYFYLGTAAPTRDVTTWLDAAIERPIGRTALLDPEVRQIAVGPAFPEGAQALGAVVTTYAVYESDDHKADEAEFLRHLARARAKWNEPAPIRVGGYPQMQAQSREVLHGKEPMAALNELVQGATEITGIPVRGYLIETTDPKRVEIPQELLQSGPLRILLAITHHRAEGAAWGQYVIFVLVTDDATRAPATASLTGGRAG
jgi:hypothetical protein